MAQMTYDMGNMDEKLEKLGSRESFRKILEAGTAKCIDELKARTQERHHIKTGSMMSNIRGGQIHEDLGSVWQYVYPQGQDPRGQSNAVKAFVINYGRGGHRTPRTGDKFITGDKHNLESAVSQAMISEAEQIKNNIMR